MLSKIESHLKS